LKGQNVRDIGGENVLWQLMGMFRGRKGQQGTTRLCPMGDVVEDGGEGKIRYNGQLRKCMLAS